MPTHDRAQPPCIVLGLETQIGLGLVRELGRAGVQVIGVSHDPHAIGLRSHYLSRKIVVPQPRSVELIATLRTLGDEIGPCCLITVSEANLQWLAAHRNELGNIRPVVPGDEQLATVLDKQLTLQAAQSVGILVPQTREPKSMMDVQTLASDFNFPAVLKWKDPNSVAKRLGDLGLPLLKAEYVYTTEQFLAAASRYEKLGVWPMVQSYCPGRGLGQFFYMHQGEAVRRFQHLRVAEWPPEGGFSSVCDSVALTEHLALQEKSIELLRHIGWEGVAMVEYRWDADTGRAVLMEINGRYWGSYPLAVKCGAAFALISHCLENGMGLPDLVPVRNGVRCRMVSTELKRLVRIIFQPSKIVDRAFKVHPIREVVRFVLDFLRPGVCYYVWDRRDPRPFAKDVMNVLRKLVGRGN
jgi:predicted ATP-grasp superfamily ATP-dependent carboligase